MATIPQIRTRLLEAFPENQADLLARVVVETHDDLVNRADFHALTCVVKELADAQKELAEAQKETAEAQKEFSETQKEFAEKQQDFAETQKDFAETQKVFAEAQKEFAEAQNQLAAAQVRTEARVEELAAAQASTEREVRELAHTQKKMLIRLDRLDGHMLENVLVRNLPSYVGREFRRCRVIERAEFVESLDERLAEEELADLLRADIIATARDRDRSVHLVVEVSCTADADDIDRAVRRRHALERAGCAAVAIVACEMISPPTLDEARRRGVRVIAGGWLLPDAA